jgi:hypothetical protein
MTRESLYPYDWQLEQVFQEGNTTAQKPQLDIGAILFDYFSTEKMRWAVNQQTVEALLSEEGVAVGNLLLNAEEPLTLLDIALELGLSTEETGDINKYMNNAYNFLSLMMPATGPLEFLSIPDREMGVLKYQIVPTAPPKA